MVFKVTINKDGSLSNFSHPAVECERIVMFFSGIIYNTGFLKRSLGLSSNSTEEVLHEIFKTQGNLPEIMVKINGYFSIVLFDKNTNMTMAVRDRNGFGRLKILSTDDGTYSFSDTLGDDVEPGVIFIFHNDGMKTFRYNNYSEMGKYWNDIRNKYIFTKYKSQFKEIISPLSHLTSDQIIDFSSVIMKNTDYPAKVDMFKFMKRVEMFKACEYTKLKHMCRTAMKSILNSVSQNNVIYILLDDDIATIAIAMLLNEAGVPFKSFSVCEETADVITFPQSAVCLKSNHTVIPYNMALIKSEIENLLNTKDSITIGTILPTYVMCKHIDLTCENAELILPTLANELFGGSFDSSVDDYFAHQITINRLSEAHRFIINETTCCVDKFNLRAHYLYNDIHIIKYVMFLNNKPRVFNNRLQTRMNIKMAFSDVDDDKLLYELVFSDVDRLTTIVRSLESIK